MDVTVPWYGVDGVDDAVSDGLGSPGDAGEVFWFVWFAAPVVLSKAFQKIHF